MPTIDEQIERVTGYSAPGAIVSLGEFYHEASVDLPRFARALAEAMDWVPNGTGMDAILRILDGADEKESGHGGE